MPGLKYSVDIVMCIDGTGSMGPVIDLVKKNAMRFEEDLRTTMTAKQKGIDDLRIKAIAFRDFGADRGDALLESSFFSLPRERDAFAAFVSQIQARGGGDEPESALEALGVAMRSDWVRSGDKRRHVIVLWTDASAHRLEDAVGKGNQSYPSGTPATFAELTALWEGQAMDQAAKRLLIYAPDLYPWPDIQESWESVAHVASKAGEGLADVDYGAVLEAIANSV